MKTTRTVRPRRGRQLLALVAVMTLIAGPSAVGANDVISLPPAVFDIDATPDGSILATGNTGLLSVRHGSVETFASVPIPPTTPPTALNGVEAIGNGVAFATTGGGDLATGAALWRVSRGGARMVADITAFEQAHDPDALAGPGWKDPRCEATPEFSAGPQSNPYHLAARSGAEALVADAAGNTLLSARTNGAVDWVAVFTPPVADPGTHGWSSTNPAHWAVLFTLPDGTDCYVQPVPTSVTVAADGAVYVGELTGAPAIPGWSRVWRIAPGAHHVTCPSAQCQVAFGGLTSVIDVELGPDGQLYVAEYHADGWFAAFGPNPNGGRVQRCDPGAGTCTVIADGLALASALTFDKRGNLWLLENNLFAPTVRVLPLS